MERKRYATDLTDEQWDLIALWIPKPKSNAKIGGRPSTVERREIVNAILYLDRTGCQWRMLPGDLPHWGTVSTYYRQWCQSGLWKRVHDMLREQLRDEARKELVPSVAIVDSQTVKTTEKGGPAAMTGARKSRAASGISPSLRWG
jgi:putative transposase